MSIKDKLISNTTYLFLNRFLMSVLSLLFWMIVGKMLLPSSYGIIATTIQIILLLSPLTMLGLNSAMNKLIPELLERNRRDKIQGLINYSFKIIFFSTIVIALILIVFSSRISSYLKLQSNMMVWIAAFSIIMSSMGTFFRDIYYGFQDMRKIFLTNLVGQLTKTLFTFVLIFFGFNYFGPLISILLCYLVVLITRFNRNFFNISKKITVDKKLIFKYSIPSLVTVIFGTLYGNTQYIILTLIKTMKTTGFFAVAMTISSVIPLIPDILSSALFPIISGLSADKKGKPKQGYLIKLVFRYSLLIILPIAILLILFSKYAILVFSSLEYLSATKFLPFLTIAGVLIGLGSVFLSALYATGKPKIWRNINITPTLVYILLAMPLTYYFSGMGLAISYLMSAIILFFLTFLYVRKYLNFKIPINDIGRIMLACFISSSFIILVKPYVDNFVIAGIFILIAGFIYLLVLLKLNFYLEEDLKVFDFLVERSPILNKQIIGLRKYLSKFVTRSYQNEQGS